MRGLLRVSRLSSIQCWTRTLVSGTVSLTKYKPYSDQFSLKMNMFHPKERSDVDEFMRDIGFTDNGIIGPELQVVEQDMYSRLKKYDKKVTLPPSYINTKDTRTSFLLIDEHEIDNVLRGCSEHVFPESIGIDKEFDEVPSKTLSSNNALGSKRFDFVFVDTSKSQTNETRNIVIREKDGTLRTSTPQERERFNQEFFAQPWKRLDLPAHCHPTVMPRLLKEFQHKFILDAVVKSVTIERKAYAEMHKKVYNDVVDQGIFHALQDSQHWPAFVRWLKRENKIDVLVRALHGKGRFADSARVVRYTLANDLDIPEKVDHQKQLIQDYLKSVRQEKTKAQ
eukprot:m.41061 g.41061  ORF g.41061 m.41061 type:complete len:338 (-) comp10395_c0_seq4:75-1088(-)